MLDQGGAFLDLEGQDARGNTLLLQALGKLIWPILASDRDFVEISFEQAHLLIDRGASCLATSYDGNSCLHVLLLKSFLGKKISYFARIEFSRDHWSVCYKQVQMYMQRTTQELVRATWLVTMILI
jgi:hypothetical protein